MTFRSNSSTGNTTAVDTLIDEAGVCRDIARLMIALCRDLNIPARFATGNDAADTAFATMFGGVQGAAPVMQIQAIPNALGLLVMPQHVFQALSTDGPSTYN